MLEQEQDHLMRRSSSQTLEHNLKVNMRSKTCERGRKSNTQDKELQLSRCRRSKTLEIESIEQMKKNQVCKGPRSRMGGKFLCTEEGCEARFPQKTNLSDHMRSVHNQSKLVCGVEGCTKAYMSVNGLYNHRKTIHSSSSKDLIQQSRRSLTLKPAPPIEMGEQGEKASILNHEDRAKVQMKRRSASEVEDGAVMGEGKKVGKKHREPIQEEMAVSDKASSVEEETTVEESVEAKINATNEVVKTSGYTVKYIDDQKSEEMSLATEDVDLEDVEEMMEVSETESSSDGSDIVIENETDLAEVATCGGFEKF